MEREDNLGYDLSNSGRVGRSVSKVLRFNITFFIFLSMVLGVGLYKTGEVRHDLEREKTTLLEKQLKSIETNRELRLEVISLQDEILGLRDFILEGGGIPPTREETRSSESPGEGPRSNGEKSNNPTPTPGNPTPGNPSPTPSPEPCVLVNPLTNECLDP